MFQCTKLSAQELAYTVIKSYMKDILKGRIFKGCLR